MPVKTAIFVDPFGSISETPEEQIKKLKKEYKQHLGVPLSVHTPRAASEIEVSTQLVLFDFGGMSLGNSLMDDHSRAIVQWAIDNPNSLVVIVSTFTYDNGVRHAIEDLMEDAVPYHYNRKKGEQHKTPLHNLVIERYDEGFLPKWFLDSVGAKPETEEVAELVPPDDPEIREAEMLLSGVTLPKLKFFNPNKKFLPFMVKSFAKQNVFDVGAGCGHIAEMLQQSKKFKRVFGIDIFTRDEMEFPVYKADARSFPFPPKSVVMFCRPCHGCFVEDVISNAISRKAKAIVYIGLEKNLLDDLQGYLPLFKRVATKVGEDGECIWLMKK